MSGGAFDYQQYRIGEIADQIEEEIHKNREGASYFIDMKPETVAALKDAVRVLRTAEIYAQRADWFFSGDDGEESFHERLKEDLAKLDA